MNKKGFTLVEIIAVIVILAILIIIAVPSIGNVFNGAKNKISSIEKKNLTDASETIVMEVLNCDMSVSDYNYLFEKSVTKCSDMRNDIIGTLQTTVEKLKEKELFSDTSNKCSGSLNITIDNNYKVSVDTSNVTCG